MVDHRSKNIWEKSEEITGYFTNLVKKLLDFSSQDPELVFALSDFQDELDSTGLVRERRKGSKLEPVFTKKTKKS